MKIRLRLQRPPRVQWVLRVDHETEAGHVIVRTWFDDYGPNTIPPPAVVMPVAIACARIARATLAGEVEACKFAIEIPAAIASEKKAA